MRTLTQCLAIHSPISFGGLLFWSNCYSVVTARGHKGQRSSVSDRPRSIGRTLVLCEAPPAHDYIPGVGHSDCISDFYHQLPQLRCSVALPHLHGPGVPSSVKSSEKYYFISRRPGLLSLSDYAVNEIGTGLRADSLRGS